MRAMKQRSAWLDQTASPSAGLSAFRGAGLVLAPQPFPKGGEFMRLSPREQEVYGLASRGYTSRYIAARLVLSPRTVETHIRHIYEKTGVTCRDELIERRNVWATR